MKVNIFSLVLQLWDVRRKGCIFTYKGHQDLIHSIQFSPDGKWIVSASEDGTAKVPPPLSPTPILISILKDFYPRKEFYAP